QAERDVLLVAVGAEIGQVLGQRGEVAGGVGALLAGLVLERLDVALEDGLAREEEGLEFLELSLGEAAFDGDDGRLRGGFRSGLGGFGGRLTSFFRLWL